MRTIDATEGVVQPDPVVGPKNLHECKWSKSLT